MTLGGFALAVGILVDNGTVVIENIERHVKEGESLREAIVSGCGEVAIPTALSTLCICIVFVPVFLLQGTAKYLFSPLSLSVCVSLIASLALSFTLVPVLFAYLMRSSLEGHAAHAPHDAAPRSRFNVFSSDPSRIRGWVSTACATAIATSWRFAWSGRPSPVFSSCC